MMYVSMFCTYISLANRIMVVDVSMYITNTVMFLQSHIKYVLCYNMYVLCKLLFYYAMEYGKHK